MPCSISILFIRCAPKLDFRQSLLTARLHCECLFDGAGAGLDQLHRQPIGQLQPVAALRQPFHVPRLRGHQRGSIGHHDAEMGQPTWSLLGAATKPGSPSTGCRQPSSIAGDRLLHRRPRAWSCRHVVEKSGCANECCHANSDMLDIRSNGEYSCEVGLDVLWQLDVDSRTARCP